MPDDNYEPQPDFFQPSFVTLGPDGNVSSIASSDYVPNAVGQDGVGFKLFDSSVVHAFLTRGGLDAGDAALTDLYVLRQLNAAGPTSEVFVRELSIQNNPAVDGGEVSIERTTGTVGTLSDQDYWLLLPSSRTPPPGFTKAWTVAGGPSLFAESLVNTSAYAGTGYTELTPNVRVNVPHAGIYDVAHEAYCIGGAAPAFSAQTFSGPGVTASDTNAVIPTLVANEREHQSRIRPGLSLAAGTYKLEHRSPSSVAITWGARSLRLIPRTLFF